MSGPGSWWPETPGERRARLAALWTGAAAALLAVAAILLDVPL